MLILGYSSGMPTWKRLLLFIHAWPSFLGMVAGLQSVKIRSYMSWNFEGLFPSLRHGLKVDGIHRSLLSLHMNIVGAASSLTRTDHAIPCSRAGMLH